MQTIQGEFGFKIEAEGGTGALSPGEQGDLLLSLERLMRPHGFTKLVVTFDVITSAEVEPALSPPVAEKPAAQTTGAAEPPPPPITEPVAASTESAPEAPPVATEKPAVPAEVTAAAEPPPPVAPVEGPVEAPPPPVAESVEPALEAPPPAEPPPPVVPVEPAAPVAEKPE